MRLEPEQLDLLALLVEAQRSQPRDQRRKAIVARMMQGDVLVHPGIPEDKAEVYFGDLEVLERYGLVYITYPGKDPNVDVTPEGYEFVDSFTEGKDGPTHIVDPDESPSSQAKIARELIDALNAIREQNYQDERLIQHAKTLNARLAPSFARVFGAVPLISTDYPPRVWWKRARENASQALAAAQAGWTQHEHSLDVLPASASSRIFIVHGREHGLKEAVARLVEALGYEPIILHEKPNRGRTVIEKFEQEADAVFAIVLLTPDDEGRLRGDDELALRARQNVVWEFGYFAGALGRGRVVALVTDTNLERPSDIHGVLYVPVRSIEDTGWRLDLAREMRSAGLQIDLNKLAD